eukprot:1079203-Pelagomonas_calceolata.AAC.1
MSATGARGSGVEEFRCRAHSLMLQLLTPAAAYTGRCLLSSLMPSCLHPLLSTQPTQFAVFSLPLVSYGITRIGSCESEGPNCAVLSALSQALSACLLARSAEAANTVC